MTHDDVAAFHPKIWGLLPSWLIEQHTPQQLLELVESLYGAIGGEHRMVRYAERRLSEGDPQGAHTILRGILPRLLDEPCDDGPDELWDEPTQSP